MMPKFSTLLMLSRYCSSSVQNATDNPVSVFIRQTSLNIRTDTQNANEKCDNSISPNISSQRTLVVETEVNDTDTSILSNNISNASKKDTVEDTNPFNLVEISDYVSSDCSTLHDVSSAPLMAHGVINLGLRCRGMHFGHLNIRGICSGEKIEQIKLIL